MDRQESLYDAEDIQDLDADLLPKDAILFAIDCHPSMFKSYNDTDTPFLKALQCTSIVVKNKIISSPDDSLGILFFHSQKMSNPTNLPHINLLYPLEQPDAAIMQTIDEMIKSPDLIYSFIGSSSKVEIPMGDVFWTCGSLFAQSTKLVNCTKRVFLFTNQDNPHPTNPILQRMAKIRARELGDLGIELELFPLESTNNGKFDMFQFYRKVISDDGEEVNRFPSIGENLSELKNRVRSKEAKRHALKKTFINLGPEMSLSVRLYNLVLEAKKAGGQYVWVEPDSNAIVYPNTKWYSSETSSSLPKEQMRLSFNYGGKQVLFTPEQVNELRTFGEAGIFLICFSPKSTIKYIQHHLRKSVFILPDEDQTRGSSVLFFSLVKELNEQGKVAICRYVVRKGTSPRLVALVPQLEQIDETGYLVNPAGLYLYTLPYAEEIRHLYFDNVDSKEDIPNAEIIDKVKEVIEEMMLVDAFNPDNYDNPSIQNFYSYLQALALDDEYVNLVEDPTLPNVEIINKKAGKLIEELKQNSTTNKNKAEKKVKLKDNDMERDYFKKDNFMGYY